MIWILLAIAAIIIILMEAHRPGTLGNILLWLLCIGGYLMIAGYAAGYEFDPDKEPIHTAFGLILWAITIFAPIFGVVMAISLYFQRREYERAVREWRMAGSPDLREQEPNEAQPPLPEDEIQTLRDEIERLSSGSSPD